MEIEERIVKMAPPWVQYANAVKAMFEKDPEIKIVYNDEARMLKLLVNNPTKAEALQSLLPEEKEFGSEKLTIIVVPANEEKTTKDRIRWALMGNRAVERFVDVEGVFINPLMYVVFKREVVQFFTDNLGDLYGNRNTLYQDLAAEIFPETADVLFCTEAKKDE